MPDDECVSLNKNLLVLVGFLYGQVVTLSDRCTLLEERCNARVRSLEEDGENNEHPAHRHLSVHRENAEHPRLLRRAKQNLSLRPARETADLDLPALASNRRDVELPPLVQRSEAPGKISHGSQKRQSAAGPQPPRNAISEVSKAVLQQLTEVEGQVTRLVVAGLTNNQVARQLGRSPHTVNYHLRQIFRKTNVSSRVKLALLYYGLGRTQDRE